MKNKIVYILIITIILSLFGGCTNNSEESGDSKITVVTTFFPLYSWVNEVSMGIDEISVTYLTEKGQDLHSYNPSVADIASVNSCDLFVYIGGSSDEWVESALNDAKCKTINLMYTMGITKMYEEFKEGMEVEEEEEDFEWDEHLYLSLDNAIAGVTAICDSLSQISEEKNLGLTSALTANKEEFISKATTLKETYTKNFDALEDKTLMFGDRFPFLYLTSEFNLGYYAPFAGCSSDSEASFETIAFLKNIVENYGITKIFVLENASTKTAETIMSDVENYEILTLNSMQQITKKDAINNNLTYLSIMESNLSTIYRALEK